MSVGQGPSAISSKAMGGLAGSRMAAAMVLSAGIHAGAAVWFSDAGLAARGGLPTPVNVHLVSAAPRSVLAPVSAATHALAPLASPVAIAPAQPMSHKPDVSPVPVPAVASSAPTLRARSVSTAAPLVRRAALSPPPSNVSAPGSAQPPTRVEVQAARASSPLPTAARSSEPVRAATPAGRTPPPGGRGAAVVAAAAPVQREPPRPAADNPRPEYPMLARRRGLQGRVLVRLEVAPDGTPSAVRVVDSSGVPSLDRAARDAVQTWRFLPARRDGQAEAATLDVPVEFRLAPRG